MNSLASLAKTALLGTERRPPDWPAFDGPVGGLLDKLPRDQTEKALLQTAGVLGTCQLAGWQPAIGDDAPQAAKADQLNHDIPPALTQSLAAILTDGPLRLQAEAFSRLTAAGCGVPYRLLPLALDAGKRSVALRASLLPAVGQRGAWLASQNESWAYALGGGDQRDPQSWELGSLDQRRQFLRSLRSADPDKGRDLVVGSLATEAARERAAFVECLETSLSLDDEDLLEATLGDKSKEVRRTAARLLSSMPESRFMQRMAARLEPCLATRKKMLRGTRVALEPPSEFVPEWKKDLIEKSVPKGRKIGERAWWLFQIVKATPLEWWEQQTNLAPARLITWATASDWSDALLQGWSEALRLQNRSPWAEAFIEASASMTIPLDATDLLETLPPENREKHMLALLQKTGKKRDFATSTILDRFLASLPLDVHALSLETARSLIAILKNQIHDGHCRYDWPLRTSLVELACVMPPELFDDYASGWDLMRDEAQPFVEAIARVGIVVDQRRQLLDLG